MRLLISILIISLTCLSIQFANAQSVSNAYVPPTNMSVEDYFESNRSDLGLIKTDDMRLIQKIDGRNASHMRFQQYVDGIPVWATHYMVHSVDGIVEYGHGSIAKSVQPRSPQITEYRAYELAIAYLGELNYSSEQFVGKDVHVSIQAMNNRPKGKLNYFCSNFPNAEGLYELVYVFDILSVDPENRQFVMVDAVRGKVHEVIPAMTHHAVPSTGETYYYGRQSFISDSVELDLFHLIDRTRGDGISTLNASFEPWSHEDRHWDFIEVEDGAAVDAHFGASLFYDMLLQQFNWEGLDNRGKELISVLSSIHYVNASWNGRLATFGRGDCNHSPLTPLEIVGHEFMHGVTEFSAGLIYRRESGAINESMSDVFGKALEHYNDAANFSWDLGHSFLASEHGESFRSFSDPTLRSHPKYYGGEYWNDNGGVHTNSSIGNHWFYVLINGGDYTNELNEIYSIQSISWDDLLLVIFDALTQSLVPTSNYLDYRRATLQIANDRFGVGSFQYKSIADAWDYVGVLDDGEDRFELSLEFFPNDTSFCIRTGDYEPTVHITNTGDVRLPQGGYLTFDGGGQISINRSVEIGETVEVILSNALKLEEVNQYEFFYATVHAPMFDYEIDGYQFITVASDTVDFSISNYNVSTNCDGELAAEFFIRFLACDQQLSDPAIRIEFSDTDGSFTHYEDLILKRDWIFRESQRIRIPLDLTFASGASPTIRLGDYESTDGDFSFRSAISSGFESDFALGAIPEFFYVARGQFYDSESYVEFEGQHYVLTNAIRSSGSLPCEDAGDDGVIYSDIYEICVDTRNLVQPVLAFDLRQFRANSNIPELEPFTAQLLVSWMEQGESKTLVISDQLNGESITHHIELPENFSDMITFSFYNFKHLRNLDFPDDIGRADIQLLNNIKLTDVNVGSEEIGLSKINVYPNPVDDKVVIELPREMEKLEYRVVSLQGQQVLNGVISSQSIIDVSTLSNGCFFILLSTPSGQLYRNKLVVQRID